MKHKTSKKTNKIIISAIILGILIITSVYLYYNVFNTKNKNSLTDSLAQCLTNKGVTLYGAYWCPHCQQQKELFGESFKYINYVECTEKEDLCNNMGIEGYPTWIVNNQKYPGVQSLDQLKKLGGC